MANADTNRSNTFGRSLQTFINSRLPYSQPYNVIDSVEQINPKYKDFFELGSRREELIRKHSISVQPDPKDTMYPQGSIAIDKNYHAFMYANVDYDKAKRLRDYRVMAQFAEVADAMDEVCDDCIVRGDDGVVIKFEQKNREFESNELQELESEFNKFIDYYELETKGWEYFRHLLVDGEMFFEHIIHKDHSDKGILGIINVPSELMDPIYDNVQNMQIKGFLLRKPIMKDNNSLGKPGQGGQDAGKSREMQQIPFDKNQITYIHSGIWNETKTLRLPFIENARRAYRQLSLIEDAIIVYRLVRAPERLVFNVDVGNMSPPKAESYLKKLMQNYWSRKTYDSGQGKSVQAFNPQSMLDSFWFAKRAGSDGTNVTQLAGGANLGELSDLLYFRQKLYRSLKVPVTRLDPESQSDTSGSTILREELKFAKFVIRLQQHFAAGIKDAFSSHLKLRKTWDKLNMKETDFNIKFTEPTNFHELRQQQVFELKYNNYSQLSQMELVSDTYAKKKYLGWNDNQIRSNREFLRKDAALSWELAQITAGGPEWRKAMEGGEPGMEPGGEMGGPPIGGGLPGAPPDFGPPPAEGDMGADVGGPPPEGGGEIPPPPPPV